MFSVIRRHLANPRNISHYALWKPTLSTAHLHCSRTLWGQLVQFKLSDIGEGIRQVTIKEWFVKPGDQVAQFDSICEVQSDKAAVTITSRYDGVIKKLHYEVDDTGYVGKPLVDIELDEDSVQSDSEDADLSDQEVGTAAPSPPASLGEASDGKVLATPAVRRLAAEHKVNLSSVTGSGKHGRVLKEDVLAYSNQSSQAPEKRETPSPVQQQAAPVREPPQQQRERPQQPKPQPPPPSKEDRRVPIKGVQKAMFESMTMASRIPHFTYSDEVDMSRLVRLREEVRGWVKSELGIPLSFVPFILKAMSVALLDHPTLNAHLQADESALIYKAEHNIGVAVDSPDGLLVPCLRNVEQQSVLDLARSLSELVEAGRSGKLTPGQLSGGTITLSNIGNIGGTYTKPVIPPPQVCIGAVGRLKKLPRFDASGAVVPAHVMHVSWSADHRVIDGATVARFSNQWKRLLESPDHFLLHLK